MPLVLSFLFTSVIQANVESDDDQKETKGTRRQSIEEEVVTSFDKEIGDPARDEQEGDTPKTQVWSMFWFRHRALTEDEIRRRSFPANPSDFRAHLVRG